MTKDRWMIAAIVTALVLGTIPLWVSAAPPAQEQNLLTNGDFNGAFKSGVATGWAPWHEDSGDVCSANKEPWDFACKPGWNQEMDVNNHGLVRSGYAQQVGVQYRPWHAGVMQTVNVTPGTPVRFSIWAYARASNDNVPAPSYGGYPPHMRVGIDPEGQGLWNAGGIVWSGEVNAMDGWVQLSVEATAGSSGRVTVFTSAKYRGAIPLKHMDTWWDDAVLVAVAPAAQPTSPPPAAAPTSPPAPAAPAAPAATSTPRPDGAVVHVVRDGDTLFGIAIQYGVSVEQIEQLNAGSLGPNRMIFVGQELVISIPSAPPTEAPPPAEEVTPTEEAPPPDTSAAGSVCVLAYHDRNADTFRQADTEEMLPNAVFSLGDASGLLGQYTTDGISEPYCFAGLPPGTYRVTMQPPIGYVPSGPADMTLTLGTGGNMEVALGAQRGEDAEATETPEEETEENGGEQVVSQVLRWAARVSGILVLVLAVALGVIFFLSRRR